MRIPEGLWQIQPLEWVYYNMTRSIRICDFLVDRYAAHHIFREGGSKNIRFMHQHADLVNGG